jgi:hypothetical protein
MGCLGWLNVGPWRGGTWPTVNNCCIETRSTRCKPRVKHILGNVLVSLLPVLFALHGFLCLDSTGGKASNRAPALNLGQGFKSRWETRGAKGKKKTQSRLVVKATDPCENLIATRPTNRPATAVIQHASFYYCTHLWVFPVEKKEKKFNKNTDSMNNLKNNFSSQFFRP